MTPSVQAPWTQGASAQSLMSTSQLVPVKPGAQVHVWVLTPLVQTPVFWQGFGAQSLMFVLQVVPEKPVAQAHVKLAMPSVHAPPFRQGGQRHPDGARAAQNCCCDATSKLMRRAGQV